jgi:hypothetical protein
MQTRQEEAESFHADRRTEMTKVTVAFRDFSKVPIKRVSNTSLLGTQFLYEQAAGYENP